ncbi:hypothetical protein MMC19_001221 [Ptychographa xylographoides]|nr:hypothetical protein [Ptychographa xylographoides]
MSTATGTVLELGPGSGSHTVYYTSPSLRSIYGVEPVSELHPALRKSAEAAGIGDKYHILHCGGQSESLIPALEKAGLLKDGAASGNGIFDTVVCVRTLCSVPDLSATIEMLYRLLRPGGRFIICEHVINQWRTSRKASMIGRGFQIFYMMLGWTFFIGDCCLNRDTAEMVKKIGELHGGWKTVELESTMEWSALPFVTGVFVKRD